MIVLLVFIHLFLSVTAKNETTTTTTTTATATTANTTTNTTALPVEIKPKLLYSLEIFDDKNNGQILKFLSLFKYEEDNTYLIELSVKERTRTKVTFKYNYNSSTEMYFTPNEFQEVYYYLLTAANKVQHKIIKAAHDIIVTKYSNPFQLIILQRDGLSLLADYKIRALIFDFTEYSALLYYSNKILFDCGL